MALVLQLSSQSVLGSWDCHNTVRVVQTTDLGFSQSRDGTVRGQGSGRAQSFRFRFQLCTYFEPLSVPHYLTEKWENSKNDGT